MIEINDAVDDYNDLSEGQIIKIPNFYAKKLELIIRESDFMPLHVKIFDEKGLYSEYEYLYFDCNPNVNEQTFNSENPAYTF
jgi:outer membrane lipoprotein-sorting protein